MNDRIGDNKSPSPNESDACGPQLRNSYLIHP